MKGLFNISCGISSAEILSPEPESPFYRGVRFDRAGLFRRIVHDGHEYSGRWLEGAEEPCRHDNVTGPVEEFSVIGYDEASVGEGFLKTGVGWLQRPDSAPYDFTRTYTLLDPGKWHVQADSRAVTFRHEFHRETWAYHYSKRVSWQAEGVLLLEHELVNTGIGTLSGSVYNHHFFTFDDAGTGVGTEVDFPFEPDGVFRAWPGDSAAGRLTGNGIRISENLVPGQKICIEHLGSKDHGPLPYRFKVKNAKARLGVEVCSDAEACRIQFWGNHKVACVEPFTLFHVLPGQTYKWSVRYLLTQG